MFRKWIFLSIFLFVIPGYAYSPIMNITPNLSSITVVVGIVDVVTFTVENNTHSILNNFVIDPTFMTSLDSNSITVQNNQCIGINLAPGQSCTFDVDLLFDDVVSTFTLSPRVCAFGGAVCSIPLLTNRTQVTVLPRPPRAYIGVISNNNVVPVPVTTEIPDPALNGVFSFSFYAIGVAVSVDGIRAYIADYLHDALVVLDVTHPTPTVVTSIALPAGSGPIGVAVSPNGQKVYVTNSLLNSVSVIDTQTNTIIATVPVTGFDPFGIAVLPGSAKVYVTNDSDDTVTVIDGTNNTVITTIVVGNSPSGIAVTPDSTKVYVANAVDNTISVIDVGSDTVLTTFPEGGSFPVGLAIAPIDNVAYVANNGSESVSVIDTRNNTLITTINLPSGSQPTGVAFTPDGSKVYVTGTFTTPIIAVIDTATNTLLAPINVGGAVSGSFGNFIESLGVI